MVPEPMYVANGDTFQSKSTGGTQNGSQCTICPTITGGTGAFANATVDGPELRLYWCRYKHCRFFPNRWRREFSSGNRRCGFRLTAGESLECDHGDHWRSGNGVVRGAGPGLPVSIGQTSSYPKESVLLRTCQWC
jgi:hypothetical protein